jgi:hypothetical protein
MSPRARLTRAVVSAKRVSGARPATYLPTILAFVTYVAVSIPLRTYLTLNSSCASPPFIKILGQHIHHEVIGIGLLLATSLIWINNGAEIRLRGRRVPIAALIFGAGAAFVVDETSLLVTLDPCSYGSNMNVAALVVGGILLVPHVWVNRLLYGRMAVAAAQGLLAPE